MTMEKAVSEYMQAWDKKAMRLPIRAEHLKDATAAFADTTFLDVLKTEQNQVIYGRRGTGKTHLLKRLEDEYLTDFEIRKIMPILINGSELKKRATRTYDTPELIALSLYIEFVEELASKIHKFINSRLPPGLLDKVVRGGESKTAQRARSIARSLNLIIERGEVRFLPEGEASDEVQNLHQTSTKAAAGVNFNLSDPRKLGWKLDAELSRSAEAKKTGLEVRKIKGQIVLPFHQISIAIEELLSLLNDASVVVLFDEWSDVDERLETQPYLADMLKRTVSSITKMHVKIACIPVRTLLATPVTGARPIPTGYELGDDITVAVDLDSAVFVENDLTRFLAFFLTVLKKHMGTSLEWIKKMDAAAFESFVTVEVFDGVQVFSELCQASAGVPRDFLELFQDATKEKVNRAAGKLQFIHIRNAAARLYEGKKSSFAANSRELAVLDGIYRNVVAKEKTYLFLLSESQAENALIRSLWSERMIHRMPARFYDEANHARFIYYQMEYGNCVDLLGKHAQASGQANVRNYMTGNIKDYQPTKWWAKAIEHMAGILSRHQALATSPAGDLFPDPKKIMVSEALLLLSGD
jgi:hypothetical protein